MATIQTGTAPQGMTEGPGFERRRSRRRRLQKPSEVRLHGLGDELGWHCAGALLNVSNDGIACRIANKDAGALCIGQTIQAVFGLGSSRTFELTARITNTTPAGTAGHRVLGLEFVEDAKSKAAQAALREAIAGTDEPTEP